MKCKYCGSEWKVNPGFSMSLTNCPFCGKSLAPEKKKLETVEDVLVEINRSFGLNVLTDETKLVAYFSDLAPQLLKQSRLLSYFIECGGPRKLASVMQASENEQTICIKQIVKKMKDEMFIEEAASQMICNSFLFAICGHRTLEVATPNQPKNYVSSGTHTIAKNSVPVLTAEELFQKGKDYYHGTSTVTRDYQRATDYYQKAANLGNSDAMDDLGRCYENGYGVKQDLSKAFSWYQKAADKGNTFAMFDLGRCYENGYGVKQDLSKAFSWYQKAADKGNVLAMVWLGEIYKTGSCGVKKNLLKAFSWNRKASAQIDTLLESD